MAKILGVGSVFIRSPDPDGLYAWYSRCLGSESCDLNASEMPGSQDPLLWSIVDGNPQSLDHGRKDFTFNLIVTDVDSALRDIAEAGGTVVGEALTDDKGRFGWFIDPDGNKIELWQPIFN